MVVGDEVLSLEFLACANDGRPGQSELGGDPGVAPVGEAVLVADGGEEEVHEDGIAIEPRSFLANEPPVRVNTDALGFPFSGRAASSAGTTRAVAGHYPVAPLPLPGSAFWLDGWISCAPHADTPASSISDADRSACRPRLPGDRSRMRTVDPSGPWLPADLRWTGRPIPGTITISPRSKDRGAGKKPRG